MPDRRDYSTRVVYDRGVLNVFSRANDIQGLAIPVTVERRRRAQLSDNWCSWGGIEVQGKTPKPIKYNKEING